MPIKPENRGRHPKDWPAIRSVTLARARDRCERCGVPNGHDVTRLRSDHFDFVDLGTTGKPENWHWLLEHEYPDVLAHPLAWTEPVRVVLTVAHLDHQPEHNDPANLQALCQRCHLAYDREHHAANAAATREAKRGQPQLPFAD